MRKVFMLVVTGTMFLMNTGAQKAELTGFYGYSFNSQLKTYYGDFKIQDNPNYGGMLSVAMATDMFVELLYNRTDTRMDYYYLSDYDPLDISMEYYQIGGLRQMGPGQVKPFVAVTLGMARAHLKQTSNYTDDTAWRFAATLGAGAKVYLSDRIGIRLQARLGMPMSLNGLFIGVGTGGASTGVSFVIPIVNFDLSAGLILRL